MIALWLVLQLLSTESVATLTRVIGHDEEFVVETIGPPEQIVKSRHGETWLYPSLCLDVERARVRGGCVQTERSLVCYYDATQPRPAERPCSDVKPNKQSAPTGRSEPNIKRAPTAEE